VIALRLPRRRRPPANLDLTALKWVAPCPPELEDRDTMPRPIDLDALLAGFGANLVFWGAFGIWVAALVVAKS